MQYEETKLKIRSDWPVSQSYTGKGANINSFGFNTDYLIVRDPMLTVELMKLYERARATLDQEPLMRNDEEFEKAYSYLNQFYKTQL